MKQLVILLSFTVCLVHHHIAQGAQIRSSIPFELGGEHMFIKLRVNDSETLDFIFDTGAGGTVISSATAAALQLEGSKEITSKGGSGEVRVKVVKNSSLQIEDLRIDRVDLQVSPLDHLERSLGRKIDGIVGYDLLKGYVLCINYDNFLLEVYESKGYKYTGDGEMVKINLGRVPTAMSKISLDGKETINAEFILDTGAGLPLAFCTPYAEKHQLRSGITKSYSIESFGLSSNKTVVTIGRLKQFNMHQYEFNEVPVRLYKVTKGVFAQKGIAGVIGNEILKRFNITFDYKRKRSYWEPNTRFDQVPFLVSYSGLSLALDNAMDKVLIEKILPASAAASTALMIGDEVLEIDGVKARDLPLLELERLLRQDGKTVEIKCKRGDQTIRETIVLKPMI